MILVLGKRGGAVIQLEPRLRDQGVELQFATDIGNAQTLAEQHQRSLCAVVVDTDFDGQSDGREVIAALRSRDGRQLPAVFLGATPEVVPRDLAFVIADPLSAPERTCRLLLTLAASSRTR